MKVAVLGAGNIGFASAAWLSHHGHVPLLWAPHEHEIAALASPARRLTYHGVIDGDCRPNVTGAIDVAARGADAILLCIPGYGHRQVMDALAPHVAPGQPVIINSSCSLSALYLSKLLARRGVSAPIVTWGTTLLTARRRGESEVAIMAARKFVHVATLPARANDAALALCTQLFGDRFRAQENILATSLININPIAHLGLALCNVTRIEYREAWPQYHYMTPGVANLILSLEQERQALARAFGLTLHSIEAHFQQSFDIPDHSLSDIAAQLHRRRGGPPGPTDMNTRFILEDTPYGLAFAEAVARQAGMTLPQHTSAINLASAIWRRDLRAANNLLAPLALEAMTRETFERYIHNGFQPRRQAACH